MQINEAKRHLACLDKDSEEFTFQVYYDPQDESGKPELAKTFKGNFNDNIKYFEQAQSQYCGIYVAVNETNNNGRLASDVTRYRAVFADYDGVVEPNWPLTPHFTTQRDQLHGHAYWLVDDITDSETFTRLQRKIAICCGSDTQIVDPCRVLRLCGTNHYKNPTDPQVYHIATDYTANGHKYKAAEIDNAFKLDPVSETSLNEWMDVRKGIRNGTGYTDEPCYISQFTSWCEHRAQPAVIGSGTLTLIRTAAWGHDRGISLSVALPILWHKYNPRCLPAWDDSEYGHFTEVVERAYQYARSAPGCMTAGAQFKALGPVPEPIGGWEANAGQCVQITVEQAVETYGSKNRMNKTRATEAMAMSNSKTSHYTLAKIYDGIINDAVKLYRWGRIFYKYDGRSWLQYSDELIKADITGFYDGFDPSVKMISGIYEMLTHLVTIDNLENNTWVSDPTRDAGDTVIFNNGILTGGKLIPHTPDFFSLHKVDYDYDPNATCPLFMKFLDDIWDKDEHLVNQMQEWMGYCLTQDIKRHKMAMFVGKSRAGKGVITDIISAMVGKKRVAAPSLDKLGSDATLRDMAKARLTLIPDARSVPFNKREAVLSTLLAITGGDQISYDVKYKDGMSHVFLTHVIMSANAMPEFIDPSGALTNRLLVFPFWNTWEGKEDIYLRSKLMSEMAGIMQWAIRGLQRLNQNDNFTEAAAGLREKEDLREDMFPLHGFIEDYCTIEDNEFSTNKELYFAYVHWASCETNKRPINERAFINELKSSKLPLIAGRKMIDGKYCRGLYGIAVKQIMPDNVFPIVQNQG